jgi:hypothetical protein
MKQYYKKENMELEYASLFKIKKDLKLGQQQPQTEKN